MFLNNDYIQVRQQQTLCVYNVSICFVRHQQTKQHRDSNQGQLGR